MISLTNYDYQWGRSEVVIIYPDIYTYIYIPTLVELTKKLGGAAKPPMAKYDIVQSPCFFIGKWWVYGRLMVIKWDLNHWIGLRENLQETMVFTIKYRAFL
jgi:hypothetical protein